MSRNIAITLDCTLRDGGYYNDWDFEPELVQAYLQAMAALKVDYIEIGLRSLINKGFKGGFAYSTDAFLNSLPIPEGLADKIGVMVNASELVDSPEQQLQALNQLFAPKVQSPVTLVRIACHVHEFAKALPAAIWLKEQGYLVGFNLMQVADRSDDEIVALATLASNYPIDALYFADSMGSLNPEQVKHIVGLMRRAWQGDLGIHTHDNMNQALANSVAAVESGVTWVDSTVTGMGRGPGNVQTEYLAIALAPYRTQDANITKLLELVKTHFKPMQARCGWGTNPYYYLSGMYGIHPTYIQEMLADTRYSEADMLAVIDYLKVNGGKKFSEHTLDNARSFYTSDPKGSWSPSDVFAGKEVLLIGAGKGASNHKAAIEAYVNKHQPIVLALNTQSPISEALIQLRVACHPIRLLSDGATLAKLTQPLITPASMLPAQVIASLADHPLLDFGIHIQPNQLIEGDTSCTVPNALVLSYALAVIMSGKARRVLLAGFDGYGADDPRRAEIDEIFTLYFNNPKHSPLLSITPTHFDIPTVSVYALEKLT